VTKPAAVKRKATAAKHARSPSGNDLSITATGLSKRLSSVSISSLDAVDDETPGPSEPDTPAELDEKTPLSSQLASPLDPAPTVPPPVSVAATVEKKAASSPAVTPPQNPSPATSQPATPTQPPAQVTRVPSQPQVLLPGAPAAAVTATASPPPLAHQQSQSSLWKQKGLLKDIVGEGLKELKNSTLEALSNTKDLMNPGHSPNQLPSGPPSSAPGLKRQDSLLDKRPPVGATLPPISTAAPSTAAPVGQAALPAAAPAASLSAQAPPTAAHFVSPTQVQQITLLSEKALACVKQQHHNINGYHPVTWAVLFEWFSYFVQNIWKKEEEAMRIIDQRKAGVRLLLTACFEMGVISPDAKPPGRGETVPLTDQTAGTFVDEYHSFLDLNVALKIANELGLEQTLTKIFGYEDQTNTSDEKKLSLESHLSYGDADRVFELLRANPPNQLSLVLRSMSRLIELDSSACIKLFVSMHPYLTVSFFFCFPMLAPR